MTTDVVSDDIDKTGLLSLTATIVAGFVGNNTVPATELGAVIATVYRSLSSLGPAVPAAVEPLTPAIPIRKSVHRDHIVCLECGAKLKMLKRHLSTDHGLTVPEYKARWSLQADYPVTAPAYAETRSQLAKQIGLGRRAVVDRAPEQEAGALTAIGNRRGRRATNAA
jgi:predicted transcriptional regulator